MLDQASVTARSRFCANGEAGSPLRLADGLSHVTFENRGLQLGISVDERFRDGAQYFFVGFNLIVLTTNLILADYAVAFASFMLATAAALVVGKSVLVANAMAVLRRYDRGPLIQPILFKTVFYWAIVFIARLLEHFIRFWLTSTIRLASFCRTWPQAFPGIASPRFRFGFWFCS